MMHMSTVTIFAYVRLMQQGGYLIHGVTDKTPLVGCGFKYC